MTQTQKQNVPALRFSEFSGAWGETKLGKLVETINGLTYTPADIRETGLLVLRSSNVQQGSIFLKDTVYVNVEVEKGKLTRKGDILLCVRNGSKRLIGKNAVVPSDIPKATHGAFMTVLRGEQNEFVSQLLQTQVYFKEVRKNLGATINSINGSDLKKFKFWLPYTLSEQQKIASFLYSVDLKIEQLGKKKSLLEQYKKGIMQKLFSQELRFKDAQGNDFPVWEEKQFRQFTKKVTESYNPVGSSENWKSVELESLGQGNGKILKTFPAKELQSIKTKFRSGDVLFGKLRPYLRKFAHVTFDGVCTSEIWVLRANGISNKLLYFIVQSSRFNQFANIQSGSKMPRSDWKIVSGSCFPIPSLPEQQKITDFLSAIDQKIALVSTELTQAKTFKKGLLQQMFI